jgi:glutamate racemase
LAKPLKACAKASTAGVERGGAAAGRARPGGCTRPVGVFDSGVGGLSVLRALRQALPHEHFIYVADTAYAPYGERSAAEITARTQALAASLVAHGAKALVVACNTATVVAVEHLRQRFTLPIVAIEPAIKPAVALSRSGVVGVLATAATVASTSVQRLCREWAGQATVHLVACPGWVEQVERGELHTEHTRALVATQVQPLLGKGADTLVMGCTHFPFLRAAIETVAGSNVHLVDPAPAVAQQLLRRLAAAGIQRTVGPVGATAFFTTGQCEAVRPVLRGLWGAEVGVSPWLA